MSTQPNDGGPAFPALSEDSAHKFGLIAFDEAQEGQKDKAYNAAYARAVSGMTLRDYIAAAALQGMLANPEFSIASGDPISDSRNAWDYADAMIATRDRKETA